MDDASDDGSVTDIEDIEDKRVRILRNEQRLGLAATLNRGIQKAGGSLVARMDADDIAVKDRLKRQISFLQENPAISIVGGDVQPIDHSGRAVGPPWLFPLLPWQIRWRMLFASSLAHPTIVARREFFEQVGLYAEHLPAGAEDYELWLRALERVEMANIPQIVLHYRRHQKSVTLRQRTHLPYVQAAAIHAIQDIIQRPVTEPELNAMWEPDAPEGHQAEALMGASRIIHDLFRWFARKDLSRPERSYIEYRGAWSLRAVLRSLAREDLREAVAVAASSPLITATHMFHATLVKLRIKSPPKRL